MLHKYIFITKECDYISDLLLQLGNEEDIRIIAVEDLVNTDLTIAKTDMIYSASDTVYPYIRSRLNEGRTRVFDNCRNKYEFRKVMAELFPAFFFDKVNLENLKNYHFDFSNNSRYIIKPIIGFMAAGARIIDKNTNLSELVYEINSEVSKFNKLYPNIFSKEFIIEQFIGEGDEYAVDMYYDRQGYPVIMNIYCHPTAKRKEYLQVLYYTSKELFVNYYEVFVNFFINCNKKLNINSFPMHAEFKMDKTGKIIPIEFNPGRFGGMGLADLTYYAFKLHSIKAFFADERPDWESIWAKHSKEYFCWVLCYNAADRNIQEYIPKHNKFKALLPRTAKLLAYKKLDYKKSPAFAIACLMTKNKQDLAKILNLEFNECFAKLS